MGLEELRARERAATPGPWEYDRSYHKNSNKHIRRKGIGWPIATMTSGFRPDNTRDADGEFIAHAREDIPYLLSEVDRLTVEIEHTRRLAEENIYLA